MAIESLRDISRSGVSAFAGGGGGFTESATAPSSPSHGDRWLDTTSGIEYTWVDPGVWVDLSEPSAADVAAAIHAATGKTNPVDADELALADSEASWGLKKLTWANLKAALLAYFKGQFREKLTADRSYYVRSDGSDSNDGLANTSGGAFLTIQKAIDTAASLDLGIYNVTISVGSGTFDGATLKSFVGAGRINIVGAGTGSTVVRAIASGSTGYCFGNPTTAGHDGVYSISSLKMESVVSGRQGLDFIYGFNAQVVFGSVEFGSFTGGSHIRAGRGAIVTNAGQAYTISGGGVSHAVAVEGGQIRFQSATITLSGTPAFTGPFADAQRTGTIAAFGNTFSGSATGARYNVSNAGGIYVAVAGTTYLPGNAAGTATSPGWYA